MPDLRAVDAPPVTHLDELRKADRDRLLAPPKKPPMSDDDRALLEDVVIACRRLEEGASSAVARDLISLVGKTGQLTAKQLSRDNLRRLGY